MISGDVFAISSDAFAIGDMLRIQDGFLCNVYNDTDEVIFLIEEHEPLLVLDCVSFERRLEETDIRFVCSKVLTAKGVGFIRNLHLKHYR